jgi:ATP-dependent DNA helicase RecG
MSMDLNLSLSKIPRINSDYLKRLEKVGLKTIGDLIFYFPFRYDDFSQIIPIAQIKPEQIVTVQGKILEIKNIRIFRRRMTITEAAVKDKSGAIKAVWFNQPYLAGNLKSGQMVSLSGKAVFSKEGGLQFSNPSYEILRDYKSFTPLEDKKITSANKINRNDHKKQQNNQQDNFLTGLTHTAGLIPIYHETEKLSSRWLRWQIKSLLKFFGPKQIQEFLPAKILVRQKLIDNLQAIKQIHFPTNQEMMEKARQRLAFDELFLIQLFVLKQKLTWQKGQSQKIIFGENLKNDFKKFIKNLPFDLTDAQRKAIWQIVKDLEKENPMNRLLEGDVGSGKTIVAIMVSLTAAKNDFQTAIMAPTEILAHQHFKEFCQTLKNSKIKIGLLTGSDSQIFSSGKTRKISREKLLKDLKNNDLKILIGTHALIQDKVSFKNLALIVIDEQHRFGVEQRAYLQQKTLDIEDGLPKTIPHLLTMTATPIPRTLALTVYGDLEISILDEMPKGRKKIITEIVSSENRKKTYDFIHRQVKKRRQVFVICPLIEESDFLGVKSATQEYEKLSKEIFPDLKIGLLHGRLKSNEKEKAINEFKKKKIDILVSTSVIEVGIDAPNATAMIIEGAERFGLAQLHQFRGRVGRGKHQSYCFLFTGSSTEKTAQRLKAIVESENGFELAERDLEIRGPGEFFGRQQSGLPDLTMANLSDLELIQKVRKEAEEILKEDSELKKYPLLAEKLKKFSARIHLE